MKQSILIVLGGALASLMVIPQMAAFLARATQEANKLREKDEIRQTFQLAPGARVELSGIRGPVEIETTDTNVAEIHIIRSAENRADLEQGKINIENGARLLIRGEQQKSDSGYGPDVRHDVKLRLPRQISLLINSVAGAVQVGDLGGPLQISSVSGTVTLGKIAQNTSVKSVSGNLKIAQVGGLLDISSVSGTVTLDQLAQHADIKSISGNLKIGQADDSLEISSISGTLSAGIAKLGTRGVLINNVSRSVELRFRGEPGAQLRTANVTGKVSVDLPNVIIEDQTAAAMRARIGKGGPEISIKSVSGGVHLSLDTQTLRAEPQ